MPVRAGLRPCLAGNRDPAFAADEKPTVLANTIPTKIAEIIGLRAERNGKCRKPYVEVVIIATRTRPGTYTASEPSPAAFDVEVLTGVWLMIFAP